MSVAIIIGSTLYAPDKRWRLLCFSTPAQASMESDNDFMAVWRLNPTDTLPDIG
ncbi:hypothetical protein EVA_04693 [gut metagenome]|uniref:Uncharacterized protein n=1 Tax=gut metagenome TaxID=749906 RepID=J9H1C6_9ZZZZ